jgi:hypothetical protein
MDVVLETERLILRWLTLEDTRGKQRSSMPWTGVSGRTNM